MHFPEIHLIDKRKLTECDNCTKLFWPAVKRAGWDEMLQSSEEVYFTKGRIIVRGKLVTRGKAKKADFVLREPRDMVLVKSFALIRPNSDVLNEYLERAIRSPKVQQQIWASVKAAAQPCLYINRIQSLLIPLPPVAEQHRIVAKVDALMALCDRLEASLTASAATRRRLLDALLAEALAPVDVANMEAAE